MKTWRKAKDIADLPVDTRVLVCTYEGVVSVGYCTANPDHPNDPTKDLLEALETGIGEITHWAPLPETPTR